jgi:hypothetical protein
MENLLRGKSIYEIKHQQLKVFKKLLMSGFILVSLFLFTASSTLAATIYTAASGNWSSTATWQGGVVPVAGDDIIIQDGHILTVDGNRTCKSIGFGIIGPKAAATLSVNAGFTLTVSQNVSCPATGVDVHVSATYTVTGGGTINCDNFVVNNTFRPTGSNTSTLTVISSINAINASKNLLINSTVNWGNKTNNGYLSFRSGTISVAGFVGTSNVSTTNTGTLDMVTGSSNATLVLSGATPYNFNSTGASAMMFNGLGATVNYSGLLAQNDVLGTTYNNLTLSGSSTKNLQAGVVVNGTMSMQGTATAITQPVVFGSNATLEYKGGTAQTTSNIEYPATSGPPNLRIDNPLGVTLNNNKAVSGLLTFVNGKIATGINKISLGINAVCIGAGPGKYICGNEEVFIPNTVNPRDTFFIGDANHYTPIYLGFTGAIAGSGSLIASTVGADHADILNAGIDPTKSVNRNWTITRNALTGYTSYDATFNFVPQDVDAPGNTANMVIRKLSGIWELTNLEAANPLFTSANNMTSLGTFQIGEISPLSISEHPGNTTACQGLSTTFSVSSPSMPAPTYMWERDANTGTFVIITGTTDGGIYSNFNSSTLNISNATGLQGYKYRVTVKNINGVLTSNEAILTVTPQPAATISYAGTPFCTTVSNTQNVTHTGSTGGFYSSSSGLSINSSTGAINPSLSNGGTYLVTYTIPASAGCPVYTTSTSIVITTMPNATISFSGSPYCASASTVQPVTRSGTAGGVFSADFELSINSSTGSILPSASAPGSYEVIYSFVPAAGCGSFSTSTTVNITRTPDASFSYTGNPFCKTVTGKTAPAFSGDSGGFFSSGAGLVIDAVTGHITPSESVAGTYTVTYTIPAANGCPTFTATTTVTITAIPVATISYAGSPFCATVTTAQPVTRTGSSGGTFSSTAGLTINSSTGAITPSTSTPGTYVVTYTIAASGGCSQYNFTTSVTITAVPFATISYTGNPFCKTVTSASVNLTGTTGGTFSAAAGLNIIV